MKKFSGFSLFELLATIAIVGVLSAVALPAYQKFAVKSKVNQIIKEAESYKQEAASIMFKKGRPPMTCGELFDGAGSATACTMPVNGVYFNAVYFWYNASLGGTFLAFRAKPDQLPAWSTGWNGGNWVWFGLKVNQSGYSFACGNYTATFSGGINPEHRPSDCQENIQVFLTS